MTIPSAAANRNDLAAGHSAPIQLRFACGNDGFERSSIFRFSSFDAPGKSARRRFPTS
jgi:hypothetical protein